MDNTENLKSLHYDLEAKIFANPSHVKYKEPKNKQYFEAGSDIIENNLPAGTWVNSTLPKPSGTDSRVIGRGENTGGQDQAVSWCEIFLNFKYGRKQYCSLRLDYSERNTKISEKFRKISHQLNA